MEKRKNRDEVETVSRKRTERGRVEVIGEKKDDRNILRKVEQICYSLRAMRQEIENRENYHTFRIHGLQRLDSNLFFTFSFQPTETLSQFSAEDIVRAPVQDVEFWYYELLC